jgi:hypothetical protein
MFPEWLKRDGGFPVKITGYNATTHAHDWTLQIIEPDGSMTADTRTISGGNLFELNDQQVDTDSYIFARWAGLDESGMSVFMCAKGSGNRGIFLVVLAQDGGGNGGTTAGNSPTWTYTLKDYDDGTTVLGTTLSPIAGTRLPSSAAAATVGTAQYKADGTLVLVQAFEDYTEGVCEEPA